ncbi:MAG TPA: hypothetical protein VJV78_05760 [Polyangiales bacterium]|nr:hypothetical protein [Polyangiales bacterium]
MRCAILTAVSCVIAAGVARAEPLPGRFEADAGAHVMALISNSCEQSSDVVSCQGPLLFAGFQLGGRVQLGPWFALGLHFAGSSELGSQGVGSSETGAGIVILERSLWLWQLALQARFDPPIWPRGLWLGAEVGAAFAVDGVDGTDFAGQTQASLSFTRTALLLGVVLGYDIDIDGGFLVGVEARGQYLSLGTLPGPSFEFGDRNLAHLPYVSLGIHAGLRW